MFSILCVSALFVQSHYFTDSSIVPKWLITLFVFGGLVLYYTIAIWYAHSVSINMFRVGIVLVAICFLQAVLGLLQYFNVYYSPSIYKITGSFDNPAGFSACLCAGVPFTAFLLSKDNKRYMRLMGWIMGTIIVVAIVLSYSRAGIISLAAVCTIFLYQKLLHRRILKFSLLAGLVALILGCYWIKKDSADGRLLIWQSCINMVKDSPWIGHGLGSFEAHYMDYQAEYFRIHGQQNRYAMLADNVKHPFNEYMEILLNFGIIGLVILFAFIFLLIYCYKLNPDIEKNCCICVDFNRNVFIVLLSIYLSFYVDYYIIICLDNYQGTYKGFFCCILEEKCSMCFGYRLLNDWHL